MYLQLHTSIEAVPMINRAAFRRFKLRLGSIQSRILKVWRREHSDLADASDLLRERMDKIGHYSINLEDDLAMSEPLDRLWMLFMTGATPGTRMWKDRYRAAPHIQRLTIRDLLVAFALAKLREGLEEVMHSLSSDAPRALATDFAMQLANSHLDAAEEALNVASGFASPRASNRQKRSLVPTTGQSEPKDSK